MHREKYEGEMVTKFLETCFERRAVGWQNGRVQLRECRIVSPMCKGACVRDGTLD
jgi:hypothetical protein